MHIYSCCFTRMWAVRSSGCTANLVEKGTFVTGTSIYLINSVTRYIILNGGSCNKQKDRECITVNVLGVKQHLQ